MVLSPWEPKTWCITDVVHPAVHLLPLAALKPPPKPPSPLPGSSLSCVSPRPVPVVPNACSRSLTGPWSAWHMGRFLTTLLGVDERFAPDKAKSSSTTPAPHRIPPPVMLLVLSVKSVSCWWRKKKEIGPFAVFRLLVVAAWLRCSAEILLLSCSLDNACRSRLAASVCLPFLYIYIYI